VNLPGFDLADTRVSALGASERLIVALDFPNGTEALAMVQRLGNLVQWFKVGLELYLAEGNRIVEKVRERGHSVFLDLKLHDIPNTVAGAVRSVAASGAGKLTIHAAGGRAMLAAAQEAAASTPSAPHLQLTATGVSGFPSEQALRLAGLAYGAGIRSFVASSREIAELRAAYPDSRLVIPGIRPAGATTDDQKRIATPRSAIADGADYLVVGRPITRAADPAAATQAILDEIASAKA